MEIAPVSGIRLVAPPKPSTASSAEVQGVMDIALARAEDDSYSGNARKGSGGQDDEENDQEQNPSKDEDENGSTLSIFA